MNGIENINDLKKNIRDELNKSTLVEGSEEDRVIETGVNTFYHNLLNETYGNHDAELK